MLIYLCVYLYSSNRRGASYTEQQRKQPSAVEPVVSHFLDQMHDREVSIASVLKWSWSVICVRAGPVRVRHSPFLPPSPSPRFYVIAACFFFLFSSLCSSLEYRYITFSRRAIYFRSVYPARYIHTVIYSATMCSCYQWGRSKK